MSYKNVLPLGLFHGLTETADSYILMIGEPSTGLSVPIRIQPHEACTICTILEQDKDATKKMTDTYQLLDKIMKVFGLGVKEAHIDDLQAGIFRSSILMTDGFNAMTIECSASDAIIISIIEECPLLMNNKILDEAGCEFSALEDNLPPNKKGKRNQLDELRKELEDCEAREDYEKAAEIQSQIDELLRQSE
ncbi:MAG: bifunctional nuclease family protein [Bacteroidales bacterium]|nr:bifunctional nuclease family protein [Bacteroidales bacterium]